MRVNSIGHCPYFGARIKINKDDVKCVCQMLTGEASVTTGPVSSVLGIASGADLSAYALGEKFVQSTENIGIINELSYMGNDALRTTLNKGAYPYGASTYSSLLSTSGVASFIKGTDLTFGVTNKIRGKIPT